MIKCLGIEDIVGIIDRIRLKLRGLVKEAYVFGSIVDGCAIPYESDVDILIVPEKDVDYFELLSDEISELLNIGLVVHLHIASNDTYRHLLNEVRKNGIRII